MNKVYNGLPMWRLFKNKIIQNNIFECYSHQFVYVELPYWFPICDKNVTSESSDWFWNEKKIDSGRHFQFDQISVLSLKLISV